MPNEGLPVKHEEEDIAVVDGFTCLGSEVAKDGEVQSEVSARLGKASRAFGSLQSDIFQNRRYTHTYTRQYQF